MDVINIDVTWRVAREGNDLPIPLYLGIVFLSRVEKGQIKKLGSEWGKGVYV